MFRMCLEKSLNFPQKSMNIFESSLNQDNLVKKVFFTNERFKTQQYAHFLGDHESVFSYNFIVPGILHFLLFEIA